jgi:hypothetical protein
MLAVAEALLASLLVTSLSGTLVSATEMTVSLEPNRTSTVSRIARMVTKNGLTSTPQFNYTTGTKCSYGIIFSEENGNGI